MNNTSPLAQPLETLQLDTPRDIARVMRCTPQYVNKLHRHGIIPAKVAIGKMIRFDRREVMAALAEHSRKGVEA